MDADVVVIGAGAAGLAAARALARGSASVVAIEARDRIGGRIFSVPTPDGSSPAELGAEFVHGPAVETRALIARSGGIAVDSIGASWVQAGGSLAPLETDVTAAGSLLAAARELSRDESVDRYLARFAGDDARRAAVEEARLFAEGFDAADPAIASAWSIADEILSGTDFASAWPSKGYAPILARLVADVADAGGRLTVSSRVRGLRWSRNRVAVDVVDAAGRPAPLTARAAVVTVPAGVLNAEGDASIAFVPDLPPHFREALRFVAMGHVVKVVMRFATPFWRQIAGGRYRDAGFFRSRGGPFVVFWTQAPVHPSDVVVAWVGGPGAERLRDVPAAERIDLALEQFGAMLGDVEGARAAFAGGATHDWTRDPFARGAYSYVLTGGADARRAIADAVEQTLFFAGEATAVDGQGGTVNGAIRSGERAARQALQALSEKGAPR